MKTKKRAGFRRNFTAKQLHDAKLIFSCRQAHFVEKCTLLRAFFWWGRTDSLFCGKATGRQTCHWHVCLDGPFESVLRMPIPQKTTILWIVVFCGGGGRIRTIEAISSRFTVCPLWPLGNSPICNFLFVELSGAGRRTRPPDLLITNQLLYRLSYTGGSNRTVCIIAAKGQNVKHFFRKNEFFNF